MSQVPTHRKSSQARAAAVENAADRRPAPHQVVLRVKRKRSDTAVESLMVATDEETQRPPIRKRAATSSNSNTIEETLADLSLNKTSRDPAFAGQLATADARLFYKRVRTTESAGSRKKAAEVPAIFASPGQMAGTACAKRGGRLDALMSRVNPPMPSVSTVSDYLEVRRLKAKSIATGAELAAGAPLASSIGAGAGGEFHVIDLQPIGRSIASGDAETRGRKKESKGQATTPSQVTPVLNPIERQMDEAVFKAFQTGDLSSVRNILSSSPGSVNYRRRLGDGTTALMAAAFHGDLDAVRYLLSVGATPCSVDGGGKTAALFAGMRGHRECFAELQRVVDEESTSSTRGRAGGGHDEFVYDLYYFEPSSSNAKANDGRRTASGEQRNHERTVGKVDEVDQSGGSAEAPVVRLSGIGPVDANAVGTVGAVGLELKFEHDSDWSELGNKDVGDDPDSNSEGYYGNDYPEDERGDADAPAPYLYDGSSCASENGSSSGSQLSSDEAEDPRRMSGMYGVGDGHAGSAVGQPVFKGKAGDGLWEESSTPAVGARDGDLYDTEIGNAEIFAWDPARASGQRKARACFDVVGVDSGSEDVGEEWM